MARRTLTNAFTLIELLVVVAIIALLISILLPSLQGAREQGKKAVCLSNMSQVGKASMAYASDDAREQIAPLHRQAVTTPVQGFASSEWGWRTTHPFAFGGRTPQKPFPIGATSVRTMMHPDQGGNGLWTANTRPLNKYVYGDLADSDDKKMDLFRCPSDTGYPDSEWVQDSPPEAAEIPCYDFLGSSFRINWAGMVWLTGAQRIGSFSVGAWGHNASVLESAARIAMYSEPLFYNFSRQDGSWNPDLLPIPGWHKRIMSDNVIYCDGSARTTKVDEQSEFDQQTLDAMNYTPNFPVYYFLRRGSTWQTDCYPAPGALIRCFSIYGQDQTPRPSDLGYTGWPFDNYQMNFPPGG